jgi:ABC-type multidrug transport system permease subunit
MQEKSAIFISLMLPLYLIGIITLLILVSFTSFTISSIVSMDKLILFAVLVSPLIFALGALISIITLFKSKKKKAALCGTVLNIVLLVVSLCCIKPFLIELKFLI